MKTSTIAIVTALGAILLPQISYAQSADDIFRRAQERFNQEDKIQESWSADGRELADNAKDKLKAERCQEGENAIICNIVVLCSRAPDIAGEPAKVDDTELMAAGRALDDVGDDPRKQALVIDRMNTAREAFMAQARVYRDRCEGKVRMAWAQTKSRPQTLTPTPSVEYRRWAMGCDRRPMPKACQE
jgi:hypothetical protein